MNVDSLEMRRNFDEIIWSKKEDRDNMLENKLENNIKEI